MDESQNPGKVETDMSKGNEKKDENILTSNSATPSPFTSSASFIGIVNNLDEEIQKTAMKGNSSKKLATSNVTIGNSKLLETGGARDNQIQIQASASNKLTNQPLDVTSSGSASVAEMQHVVSIEVLSDDCLLLIFRYLSIVDKIKIERVSHRWNDLAKSSWRHVKQLYSNSPSWGFRPRGFLSDEQKIINVEELKKVLQRCGEFLESIDVTEICNLHNRWKSDDKNASLAVASCVASYCPDITSLTIVLLNVDSFRPLAKNCKNIVELCIKYFRDINKIDLSDFLSNYKNLRILKLPNLTNGSFLPNLLFLETLEVDVRYSETRYLIKALINMKNLKVIKLRLSDYQTNDVIVALQNCSNLEKLYLRTNESDFSNNENQLGLLLKSNQKLETLSLRSFHLSGECLIYLNPECFKELRFYFCRNLNFIFINKFLKNFNQLSKFVYANNKISFDSHKELMKFISTIENLKFLKLDFGKKDLSLSDNFNLLSNLINLEELILKGWLLNKYESLKLVGKICKNLKTLRLKFYDDVYDDELNKLTSLPKLEELSLTFLNEITGLGFHKMENLKKLKLRFCDDIKIDCLKKVLAESEKLEYLFIDCRNINAIDLLLFANEVTKKRTNDTVLYIHQNYDDIGLNCLTPKKLNNVKKSKFLEYAVED